MAYAKGVFSSKSFQALVAVAVTKGVGVLVLGSESLAAFTEGDNERIPKRKIKLNAAKAELMTKLLMAFDNNFITCYII